MTVFSGQPEVVHKFALNLANHFEPHKGERLVSQNTLL